MEDKLTAEEVDLMDLYHQAHMLENAADIADMCN